MRVISNTAVAVIISFGFSLTAHAGPNSYGDGLKQACSSEGSIDVLGCSVISFNGAGIQNQIEIVPGNQEIPETRLQQPANVTIAGAFDEITHSGTQLAHGAGANARQNVVGAQKPE